MPIYNREGVEEYTDCRHAYGVDAFKSYGSNIPDDCQGCVFPGDEAHLECDITKDYCDAQSCPFGPGFFCRRDCDSSIEDAARALFHSKHK